MISIKASVLQRDLTTHGNRTDILDVGPAVNTILQSEID